jgi:predicted HicB family RNase H-like nuclease
MRSFAATGKNRINDNKGLWQCNMGTPIDGQKPYSGKLMLRIPPEVHAHAAMVAEAHGKSLNQWAADVLMYANGRFGPTENLR